MTDTIDIIRATREILSDPKNWCHQGGSGPNGEVCLILALQRATASFGSWHLADDDAVRAIRKHIPTRQIVEYNDDPSTTHQDILNVLDKTLADLGGLA